MISRNRLPLLAFVVLVVTAVVASAAQAQPEPLEAPPALDHGWEVAAPSTVGFDEKALASLADSVAAGRYGAVDAMLLFKDDQLVFERYFRGYGVYTLHTMQSVTKSVASTLVGLAMQESFIDSVDQPISAFFPDYERYFEEAPLKRDITLRHLLTMTAGFNWPEDGREYTEGEHIIYRLQNARDWPGFVLSRDMASAPGEAFDYSTGVSVLLGVVVRNASGMATDDFAERYLFDPLGIPNYGWWRNTEHPASWVHTGGGLHMSPRDVAKIGFLYLNEGRWQGQEVLSTDWIEGATTPRVETDHSWYGYQWWLRPLAGENGERTRDGVIHASGWGGQHILIVPRHDLIAVFTSSNFDERSLAGKPRQVLYDHIIPALTSAD